MLRSRFKRIFAGVSVTLTTGIAGTSLYFLHKNNYDIKHFGAVRFARAGLTASEIIVDYKWNLLGLTSGSEEYATAMKGAHQRGADRILDLCKANGGVFIKVGQHVAALQYLLPDEYTSTLSVLHSKAPESDLDEVKAVVRDSLGKDLDEIFSSFDPQPVGVASLAQVHPAVLRSTGEKVAVKIQHPRVKARSIVDIATMEFFVRIAAAVFPDFKLMWLVDEVKRNLPIELDFIHEASNADRVRRMFDHLPYLKVPAIHSEYCSDRVLTMEFLEGAQVNDLEYYHKNKIDPVDVCRKLGRLYSEMIFINGYVHCDPHPGNVLVRKDPKTSNTEIVLLDHGLYSTLPDDFRIDYCNLWNALLKPDKAEIKRRMKNSKPSILFQRICTKMNVGELYDLFACIVTSRSWQSVTEGVHRVKQTKQEVTHIQEFAASLIPQISQVLDRMPRHMLLILKTNDLLRAIERSLGASTRKESFLEMARCCAWARYRFKEHLNKSYTAHWLHTFRLYWTLLKIKLATWYYTIQAILIPEVPSKERILS
uniref:ABC1 domain-containing protein n=1 Tax=Panagrellus redivivus TaxID=6233 RepID=A0A7E4UUU0_PANRE